jgi:hypothetical protein
MDYKMRSLHFELINKITPKYKVFPTNMLDSQHDYACEKITRSNQRMQKLKREGDIRGNQGSNHFKPLFMGVRTFIQTTNEGDAFFVYAIPTLDPRMQQHEIPIQYKDYKDVFEKKNANTLLEHWPYDCVIDLEERVHPPFGPIYNLSQNKLLILPEYIDKNLEKGFI